MLLLLAVGRLAAQTERAEGWPRCLPGEIEVVILGTYHMAGSRDDIQRDIDNVLSERRQSEIVALVGQLMSMRPDRVAVEVDAGRQSELDESYEAYRTGQAELAASEVQQIGFRLAAGLQHARIYPIDYRLGIGNDSIGAFYNRNPEARDRSERIWEDVRRSSELDDERLARSTIGDYLRWENSEDALRSEGNRGMYAHLLAGEGDNYGGAVRPLRDIFDLSPHFCPVSPLRWLD